MSGITDPGPISNPLPKPQEGSSSLERKTEQTEKTTGCAQAVLKWLGLARAEKPLTSDGLEAAVKKLNPSSPDFSNASAVEKAACLLTENKCPREKTVEKIKRIVQEEGLSLTRKELSALQRYGYRLERRENAKEFLNNHFEARLVQRYISLCFSSYSKNIDLNDSLIVKTLATLLRRVKYCEENPGDTVNDKILTRCLEKLQKINEANKKPGLNKTERMALRKQILAIDHELYKMDLRPQKGWRWKVNVLRECVADRVSQLAGSLAGIRHWFNCLNDLKKTKKTDTHLQTLIEPVSTGQELVENAKQKYKNSKEELDQENATLRLVAFLANPDTDLNRFQLRKLSEHDEKNHFELELEGLKYYASIRSDQHIELSNIPTTTDRTSAPILITEEKKTKTLKALQNFALTTYIEGALTREAYANRYLFKYEDGTSVQADNNQALVLTQVQTLVPEKNSTAQLLLQQLLSQTGKTSAATFFADPPCSIRQVQEELMENHFSVTKTGNIIEVVSPLEIVEQTDDSLVLLGIIRLKHTMDISNINDPKLSMDIMFEDPNSAENLLHRAKKHYEKQKTELEKEFQTALMFPLISDDTTDLTTNPLQIQEIGISSNNPNQKALEISWNGFVFYAKYNETTEEMSVQQIEEAIERHDTPVPWNPTNLERFIGLLRKTARKYTEEVLDKDLLRATYVFVESAKILESKQQTDRKEQVLGTISNFTRTDTASEALLKYLLHQQAQSPTSNLLSSTPPILYSAHPVILWGMSDDSKTTYTVTKSETEEKITVTTHLKLLNAPGEQHLADVVTKQTMNISDINNPKLSWEIEFHDKKTEATQNYQLD